MKPIVGNMRIKKAFGRWKRKVYIDFGDSIVPKTIGIFNDLRGMVLHTWLRDAIDQAYDAGKKAATVEYHAESLKRASKLRDKYLYDPRKPWEKPDKINIANQAVEYAEAFASYENQEILNAMTICARQGYNLSELELIYNPGRINREPAGTLQLTSRFSIKHKPTNKIIWPQ